MTEFNPSEDLKKHISESDIMSYRTTDGSYILAEEVDYEESLNITYVAGALELVMNKGRSFLQPWLMSEDHEVVEIFGDKIVGRAEPTFELKMHYHRYFLTEKLMGILTQKEMDTLLNEMFNPPVDKQDLKEEEPSWIVDNGINQQSAMDYHMQWRKKHKGN